jgi:hypothetical protein
MVRLVGILLTYGVLIAAFVVMRHRGRRCRR